MNNEERGSHGDIIESFVKVERFLHDKGINRSNIRLIVYRQFLEQLRVDNQPEIDPIVATRVWREIHELVFVISAFIENGIEPPVELLKKSMEGKPLDEYENEPGRNFFLELRAAIYFLRVGYSVQLDEDADVVAVRGKTRIYVECKRLYSEKKAEKRIREAYKQLDRRLASADRSFKNLGLVWADPSPAMQQHYFMYSTYSSEGARCAARTDLWQFWRTYVRGDRSEHDRRIFAVLLQIVTPCMVAHAGGVLTIFTSQLIPGHPKIRFFDMWHARKLLHELIDIDDGRPRPTNNHLM